LIPRQRIGLFAAPRGYAHVVTTQEGKTVYVSGVQALAIEGLLIEIEAIAVVTGG